MNRGGGGSPAGANGLAHDLIPDAARAELLRGVNLGLEVEHACDRAGVLIEDVQADGALMVEVRAAYRRASARFRARLLHLAMEKGDARLLERAIELRDAAAAREAEDLSEGESLIEFHPERFRVRKARPGARAFRPGQKGVQPDDWRRKPRVKVQNGVRTQWRTYGPFSSSKTLAALLDRRTHEGKFAAELEDAVVEHLGGDPTAPQRLVIQCATLKALRVALLSQLMVTKEGMTDLADRQLVAWMNSLRLDLQALGMMKPEQAPRTLRAYLIGKAEEVV
jgi:hypothetical protein